MKNPWSDLCSEAPYILEMDNIQVREYDSRQLESAKLVFESIPEPFIGNPETAKVALLLLNPGHSHEDPEAHRHPALKEALFRNLKGEPQQYPFYPLNPALSWSPTAKWWIPRTRELKKAAGLTDLALSERLLAIEWFPYHSRSSGLPKTQLCKSQTYTFNLATKMRRDEKLVLRMRSVNHWSAVDPKFRDSPSLKNPRCGYITRRNTEEDLFERIVDALTAS